MLRRRALALLAAVVLLVAGCDGSSPTAPGSERYVYAALGASDAVGVGAFPLSNGYVFQLADRIEGLQPALQLRNLGISGAVIDEFLAQQLPAALAAQPDVITVWTGSNDLVRGRDPERFGEQLAELLRELRTGTSAVIAVGDLVDLTRAPLFRVSPDPDVTAARVAAFNTQIQTRVAQQGLILVRLSDAEVSDELFSIDGFHPSNQGHTLLADAFYQALEPALR